MADGDPAGGDQTDLDAIRARADAATAGPWFRHYGDVITATDDPRDVEEGYEEPRRARVVRHAPHVDSRGPRAIADATFIAHARADIPALLDLVERLRAQRAAALAIPPEPEEVHVGRGRDLARGYNKALTDFRHALGAEDGAP